MRLEKLAELACEYFGITYEEFSSEQRGVEQISIARHCFRLLAVDVYKYTHKHIKDKYGWCHATVIHSINLIKKDKVFETEYLSYKFFVKRNDISITEKVVDGSGIERLTNDAFDERFYKHPERNNPRTGLPYFPAYHFVTSLGAPEPIGLTKWRQDKGHFADYILERSSEIGSYVHDCIDRMIKADTLISHDDINNAFPNAKESQRVKDCLLGFINFMHEYEPVIVASERMLCGNDFGFTQDTEMYLNTDDYKARWTVDWKTSKVANDDHKMQVEAMRRVSKCDRGMVVVLGNSTKKKYTATVIPIKDHDHLWTKFEAIKEVAYVEMLKRNQVKPREDNMPHVFSLKDVKFKRKL